MSGGANGPTLTIGDKMPDGTVWAGLSPDTGKPMFTMPADAPLTSSFNGAAAYAETLAAYGHHDWRVPSLAELKVLFRNRAAIGGFNESGSMRAGWYWSSETGVDIGEFRDAIMGRFSDGRILETDDNNIAAFRCVRG